MPITKDALSRKHNRLIARLRCKPALGVAFSGGVDSTLLLAVARHVLKGRVTAFTARSPIHARGEIENAVETARTLGVPHILFDSTELDDPDFLANTSRRCYFCKKRLFSVMRAKAAEIDIRVLAHGANLDDLDDERPGFAAAEELDISAPLIEAGLTKADIRALAKRLGLENWNRPAMACLATRIPYGIGIELEIVKKIQMAEEELRRLGFEQYRVRHHGNLARIEITVRDMDRATRMENRGHIVDLIRSLGYDFVCLDLEGYISGKMNRAINK
jgi:pyridinium-3,5-biscarboxylic acid mononucleotide sulfurtransferase